MLKFKEGQTYVCTKAERPWWTEGKEYTVVLNSYGIPVLVDNGDDKWSSNALNAFNNEFKLKEKTPSKEFIEKDEQTLLNVLVTKYNGGEGIVVDEYKYITKYSVTDDYLILDDDVHEIKTYIKKDQVLEFEVYYE